MRSADARRAASANAVRHRSHPPALMNKPAAARPSLVESLETRRMLANLIVTSLADGPVDTTDGLVTLREAVQIAHPGDTVDLTGLAGTITLTQGEIVLDKPLLTLDGPGSGVLSISGNDASRILRQTAGPVLIDDLTLRDGNGASPVNDGEGGACFNHNGDGVAFERVILRDNFAAQSGGAIQSHSASLALLDSAVLDNAAGSASNTHAYGGGVHVFQGDLTITRSTLAGNRLTIDDTGTARGGGLLAEGDRCVVRIVDSTIADNEIVGANGHYGGFALDYEDSDIVVTGTSVTNNASASGQGQLILNGNISSAASTTTLRNLLLAGNRSAGQDEAVLVLRGVVSVEHVVAAKGLDDWYASSDLGNPARHNRLGTPAEPLDVRLGTFGMHGGLTPTVPLLAGSVGIDDAGPSASVVDQRGYARSGPADVGSFEFNGAGPNAAPVFTTTSLPAAVAGQKYSQVVSATDADGDSLTIAATAKPAWLTVTDNGDGTATLSGTPTYNDSASTVTLTAHDGTDTDEFSTTLVVTYPNRAPIYGQRTLPAAIAGEAYSETISASDPDGGDVLRFRVNHAPDWLLVVDNGNGTATLSGTPTHDDEGGRIDITVRDSHGAADYLNTTLTLIKPNRAPSFVTTSLPHAVAGKPYLTTITAADPDAGDSLLFLEETPLPAWLDLVDNRDGTATLSGTPTHDDEGGKVDVAVADEDGGVDFLKTSLTLVKPNRAPTFVTTTLPPATVGRPYSATVAATDPDGDAILLTYWPAPSWLNIVPNADASLTLSGTPGSDDVGTSLLKFGADDHKTLKVTTQLSLAVAQPANHAPSGVTYDGPAAVAEDAAVGTTFAKLRAVDFDANDSHTFGVVGDAGPFIVDAKSGDVTLVKVLDYEAAKSHTIRVSVADAAGATHEGDVTIKVADVTPPVAPGSDRRAVVVGGKMTNNADKVSVGRDAKGRPTVTVNGETRTLDKTIVAVTIETGDGDDQITVSADAPAVWLDAGKGNDIIRFEKRDVTAGYFNVVRGGEGDDYIEGTPGRDALYGELGNDTLVGLGGDDALYGGEGDDSLVGGDGNDSLDGGAGDDRMSGGAGVDLAWYKGRETSVTIRLDGSDKSGDGRSERDRVAQDVENALGGRGDDVLVGNDAANYLVGLAGNDSLSGLDGKDTLDGGDGDDLLEGGDDLDLLYAGRATTRDRLFGGGGFDRAFAVSFSDVEIADVESSELLKAA